MKSVFLSAVLLVVFACGPGLEENSSEQPEAPDKLATIKPPPEKFTPTLDHDVPGKPTDWEPGTVHSANAWSLSLGTFPSTGSNYVGLPISVTAISNQDVGPTPYYIKLYYGNAVIASCHTGTKCTGQVTENSITGKFVVATIARGDGSDEQANAYTFVSWGVGHPMVVVNPSTLAVGGTSTVTAKVNLSVGPTPWFILIYDTTTGTLIKYCSTGKSCSVQVSQAVATTHAFQAFVGPYSTEYPPPAAREASVMSYVTWANSGYTLSLTSPAESCNEEPITVTAATNVNLTSTPYWLTIYRQDTGKRIKSCGTGTTCTTQVLLPADSDVTFVAFIGFSSESLLPDNIHASSNVTETITRSCSVPN